MLNRRAIAALSCAGCLAACLRSEPRAVQPLTTDSAAALAWIPSDITFVTHFAASQIALITYARSTLKDRRPSCFDPVAAQVKHHFMLNRFPGDRGVNAFHGSMERVATEECAVKALSLLYGARITFDREGAVTRFTASGASRPLFVAWADDGWAYMSDDRSRAEAMLKRPAAPTLTPALRPYLDRVAAAGEGIWSVFAGDVTTPFLGVPSSGFVARARLPGSGETTGFSVSLSFAREEEARRASGVLGTAASSTEFPPALRAALSRLRPTVRANELDIDVGPLFSDVEALEAAVLVMKKRIGQP